MLYVLSDSTLMNPMKLVPLLEPILQVSELSKEVK